MSRIKIGLNIVYSLPMNEMLVEKITNLLSTPQKIVLVAHKNPDGDAVGSTLGMQNYLLKKGHQVQTVLPNNAPEFLQWLPSFKSIYTYDKQNFQSKKAIKEATVLFLLDFNAFHRVGDDMQKALEAYEGEIVMIDHHQQPDPVSEYIYSDTSICSTCQMVYHFIESLGDVELIDETIGTALYTGIMTDTGSFRFASTTSTTHRVVADLIDKGAQNASIHEAVFNTNSPSRLMLLGKALSNLVILQEYGAAYITLSQQELNDCNFQKGDTEGFVNYGLSLKGINLAAIFIEDTEQGIVKISLRSKGKFSVNLMSRNHFDGGGHDNAAGGRSTKTLIETAEKFKNLLPQYQNEIIHSDAN